MPESHNYAVERGMSEASKSSQGLSLIIDILRVWMTACSQWDVRTFYESNCGELLVLSVLETRHLVW